jgi:hypothetical protein
MWRGKNVDVVGENAIIFGQRIFSSCKVSSCLIHPQTPTLKHSASISLLSFSLSSHFVLSFLLQASAYAQESTVQSRYNV